MNAKFPVADECKVKCQGYTNDFCCGEFCEHLAKRSSVLCKCIACGATREVGAGSVAPGDRPLCLACFMPVVPVRVRATKRRKAK